MIKKTLILRVLIAASFLVLLGSCNNTRNVNATVADTPVFEKGQKAPAKFFTGDAYLQGLVDNDSTYNLISGSVYFTKGARTYWHKHASGQILLVTSGIGYHQIKGKPLEIIKKGDVVKCPPNVWHWHGASAESDMSHIHIVPNTERGIVEWGEPVTDAQYSPNK